MVLAFVVGCGSVQAQDAGWWRLGSLPQGSKLLVTTTHTAPCELERVADEGIACGFRGRVYWVDRERILRVSLEKRTVAVPVGTAIGAAAGGVTFGLREEGDSSAKAFYALVGAGLGGWIGYGIGHLVRRPEGLLIYQAWVVGP